MDSKIDIKALLKENETIAQVLKSFDTCQIYGPAGTIDPLVRWNRAKRLNLNPPERVEIILKAMLTNKK